MGSLAYCTGQTIDNGDRLTRPMGRQGVINGVVERGGEGESGRTAGTFHPFTEAYRSVLVHAVYRYKPSAGIQYSCVVLQHYNLRT